MDFEQVAGTRIQREGDQGKSKEAARKDQSNSDYLWCGESKVGIKNKLNSFLVKNVNLQNTKTIRDILPIYENPSLEFEFIYGII